MNEQISKTGQYKRRQVSWVLWKNMSEGPPKTPAEPPKKFEYWVKRLVDLDRMRNAQSEKFAFYEELPGGHGTDLMLSEFDAFCLGVGLNLLDMGLRQTEVVEYFSEYRNLMRQGYDSMMENLTKTDAFNPSIVMGSDKTHFLAFQKTTMPEIHGLEMNGEEIALPPLFFNGADKLNDYFVGDFPEYHKNALILEVGHIAIGLREYLSHAPEFKRGRQ